MRLDHQVTDGQHEALLVDHDAGALALAPEALHRLAVGIDEGLDAHHRGDQFLERGRAGGECADRKRNQRDGRPDDMTKIKETETKCLSHRGALI
jgi:hypothetical protein